MEWEYKGEYITELPPGKVGFVYATHYSDGSYYIGKKLAKSERRKKPTKKQLAVRKNYKRVEIVEHKWREYEGSASLKDSYTLVAKEILAFCNTKIAMTYMEMDLQFKLGVLFDPKCLNQNIAGKFFPGVLDGEEIHDEKESDTPTQEGSVETDTSITGQEGQTTDQ